MFNPRSTKRGLVAAYAVLVLGFLGINAEAQTARRTKPQPKTASVSPPAKYILFDEIDELLDSWRLLSNAETSNTFYDRSRVTIPRRGIVRVWTRKTNNPPKRLVSESLSLFEINCAENTIRSLSYVAYDKDGSIISSESETNAKWSFNVPESIGDELWYVLCKGTNDLESKHREQATEYYLSGLRAESKGDYKQALSDYQWARFFLTYQHKKVEAAITRMKAKLPTP